MARKPQAEEGDPGAPEWMVTFSDCMTLLLTFFVLMLSFSSFDEKVIVKWNSIFAKRFSLNQTTFIDRDSVVASEAFKEVEDYQKGSEKPTLATGRENNLVKEAKTPNYNDRKVFIISSDKVFYGNGTVISITGRKILADLASFLREMPARIVVSENGNNGMEEDKNLGMNRAWTIVEYMTKTQSLDKQMFSISIGGTVSKNEIRENELNAKQDLTSKDKRMLEIVLLERSIYN
ncbi:MAG: hypothetical protein A2Y10_04745 [Planctomycetes bacterium GWF2_41_51]|nr:MAG: hypothetical protein A2Y10_04745 [Planctomycetes bacterium GWF2_41_51]HBG26616.1 hypothetical protein [Phycisphaerales bacterium]